MTPQLQVTGNDYQTLEKATTIILNFVVKSFGKAFLFLFFQENNGQIK